MPFFSPLMLLSLATSGLGTVLQKRQEQQNQQRQINARNAVLFNNQQDQRRFADQAQLELNKSINDFSGDAPAKAREAIKADQTEQFKAATDDDVDYHYGDKDTPANLKNAVIRRSAETKATGDRDAENLASMNSFSQGLFDSGLNMHENARNLGMIADAAGGRERLVPIEAAAAVNNAYEPPNGLGTLLQLAGGAGSMYAGSGGSLDSLFGSAAKVTPSAGFGDIIKKSLLQKGIPTPQNSVVAAGGFY